MNNEKNGIEIQGPSEGPLKLDLPTMEKRVVHYPDVLREPVLWLSSYVRHDCADDLDILVDTAKKLGVELDKTTWSRVLRGRWNQDRNGREVTPLVKLEKLLKHIDTLKKDFQLKEQAGRVPFVMTSRATVMFDFVKHLRAPERVNKFGIIVGRTGTEKSATTKEYSRRNNHLTCVHQEAPARPSYSQFVTDLAVKYGMKRGSRNWGDMLNHIYESVNEKRTIILENVQRLYVEKKDAEQPVFNFLQKLQDETGCTIILTITPVFAETLVSKLATGYFEQFIGRAGGVDEFLTLPDHATEEDVLMVAKAFDLDKAENHLPFLIWLSRQPGLIRILFGALQDGKDAASKRKERLTIDHVMENKPKLAERWEGERRKR